MLVEGYENRQEQQDLARSYFVANVMNALGCKPKVTPQKLLEGLHGKKTKKMDAESKDRIEKEFAWAFDNT